VSRTSAILLLLASASPGIPADVVINPGRHPSPGFQTLLASDGKTAVTVGRERCARVWELATGRPLDELWLPEKTGDYSDGRHYAVGPAWLGPDGKTLAMRYTEPNPARHKLVLIPLAGPDRGTYRVVGEFPFAVDSVAFSPDGALVAVSFRGPPVTVWDIATGKKVSEMTFDGDMRAAGMAFTPDGKRLTVALPMVNFNSAKHSGVSTFDVATGKFLGEIPWKDGPVEQVSSPRWSPDGRTLAINQHTIEFLLPDGTRRATVRPPDFLSFADAAAFDTAGRFLVAWRKNGEYTIRDELAGREVARFRAPATRIQFSADGSRALEVGETALVVHDLTGRVRPVSITVANHAPNAIAWKEGPVLAWGHGPDTHKPEQPLQAALDFARLTAIGVDPGGYTRTRKEWGGVMLTDDSYRATATTNGKAVKLDYEPELDSEDIKSTTLVGPEHAVLVTGAGTFGYDTTTGRQVCRYPRAGGWALAAAPDGTRFAANSFWDPLVRVMKPGEPDEVLTLYSWSADWVAWTPDGAWASSERAEKWAGTLSKPVPGKLPTFVPLDPAKRDPAKVRAAVTQKN
jgi:WD40 repeat protein